MKEFIKRLKIIYRFLFPKKPCAILGRNVRFDYRSCVYNLSTDPKKISIGDGCRIDGTLTVWKNGGEIIIGKNSYIGLDTRVWSAKKIKIGDNVQIAHNVNIFDNNIHSINPDIRRKEFIFHYENDDSDLKGEEIIIENDVWIGTQVVVLKGVRIGENSIVGSGSIVTKSIPSNKIVAGNPLKIIGEIPFH